MSYRNPRQTIDNRLGKISQGVSRWYEGKLKDRETYEAAELKDNEEVATKIKSSYKPDAKYDTAWNKAKAAGDKFTSKLYDTKGERAKGAPKINEQINEILANIGTELDESLKDPSLSERQQNELRNQAIANMNNFTQQMANWQLGMDEYLLARTKAGGVGGLLADETGHRNKDLIKIFEHITDDKDSNVWMTWKNGQLDFIEGKFDKDNEFQVKDYVDFTGVIGDKDRFGDGQFFLHNQAFDEDIEYKGFDGVIKDLAGRTDLMVNDELDYIQVKNYFETDEAGQKIMATFVDSDNEGITKWNQFGGVGNYSEDAYLAAVLERGLKRNKLTAPVVEEEDTTTTATNAASQTTTTNTASTTTGGGVANATAMPATTTTTTTVYTNDDGEEITFEEDSEEFLRGIETTYGGLDQANGTTRALPSYAKGGADSKKIAEHLNSKTSLGKTYKDNTDKKGLKVDIGEDIYNELSDAAKAILRMEHLNVGWNPKVLMLQTAGIISEKDRGAYHNGDKDVNELYEKNKDKIVSLLKGKDSLMLENLDKIYKDTRSDKDGNADAQNESRHKGFQEQYTKRIADIKEHYKIGDSKAKNTKQTLKAPLTENDKKKMAAAKEGDIITLDSGQQITKGKSTK